MRSLFRLCRPAFFTRTALLAGLAFPLSAYASSHSDAPLIKQDPQANLTDLYAFVGTKYDDPSVKVLNVLVSVRPFSEPGDGVIYERFADDALYSINLTDPVTGIITDQINFEFFSIVDVKNPDTILSYGRGNEVGAIATVGDARQNFTQTYTFTTSKVVGKKGLKENFRSAALPSLLQMLGQEPLQLTMVQMVRLSLVQSPRTI